MDVVKFSKILSLLPKLQEISCSYSQHFHAHTLKYLLTEFHPDSMNNAVIKYTLSKIFDSFFLAFYLLMQFSVFP